MKTIIKLIALGAFLMTGLLSYGQCCKAFAGPSKFYCRDSVQIGGTPADSVACGRGCTAISFHWLPTTGLSNPSAANPWAQPATTTVYTLGVLVLNFLTHDTCCFSTSTVTVTVLPRCQADAGTGQTICISNTPTVTLGGSPSAVDSCSGCDSTIYSWSPSSSLNNPGASNPVASPTVTTTYTLTTYAVNSVTHDTCCSSSDTVTINVKPPFCKANAGSPKSICCPGGSVTIGGSPSGLDSCSVCDTLLYRWLPTTGLSNSSAPNPLASPGVTTTYTLTVYAVNKTTGDTCCSSASTVKVTVTSFCCRMAGVQSNAANADFNIYPNPATQAFTIQIDHDLVNGSVEVYDVNGKVIWQKNNLTGSGKQNVDLSEYPKGVYFVRVKDKGKEVFSQKVLLQ